jgi:hypothetical protein
LKKKSSVLLLHWWRLVCRPRGRPGNSALVVPLYIKHSLEEPLSALYCANRVMTPHRCKTISFCHMFCSHNSGMVLFAGIYKKPHSPNYDHNRDNACRPAWCRGLLLPFQAGVPGGRSVLNP